MFEGRDAAGKGGTIKRFMEHLSPRGARVVAWEKPTDLEKAQWYFQHYVTHHPTAGEMVLFDRSWYNRAGVERVMGFCTPEQHAGFMRQAPMFEDMLVSEGLDLTKFWFSVSPAEQRSRFAIRLVDPIPTSRRGSSSRATTRSAPASMRCAISWRSSTTTRRTMRLWENRIR